MPELVIDTDAPPDPPDLDEPPTWAYEDDDPESRWFEQQARSEALEAMGEAAAYCETRKRALRAADRRRGS
jgi:hypothetical protein